MVLTISFGSTVKYSFSQTTGAASSPSCTVQLTLVMRCPGSSVDVDNTINAIVLTTVGSDRSTNSEEVPKITGCHGSMPAIDIVKSSKILHSRYFLD